MGYGAAVKYWEIILKNLRNAGWNCGSMATTDGKGRPIDAIKVALARRLRKETAVSLKWLAENLYVGTWTHASNRLYHCAN